MVTKLIGIAILSVNFDFSDPDPARRRKGHRPEQDDALEPRGDLLQDVALRPEGEARRISDLLESGHRRSSRFSRVSGSVLVATNLDENGTEMIQAISQLIK